MVLGLAPHLSDFTLVFGLIKITFSCSYDFWQLFMLVFIIIDVVRL